MILFWRRHEHAAEVCLCAFPLQAWEVGECVLSFFVSVPDTRKRTTVHWLPFSLSVVFVLVLVIFVSLLLILVPHTRMDPCPATLASTPSASLTSSTSSGSVRLSSSTDVFVCLPPLASSFRRLSTFPVPSSPPRSGSPCIVRVRKRLGAIAVVWHMCMVQYALDAWATAPRGGMISILIAVGLIEMISNRWVNRQTWHNLRKPQELHLTKHCYRFAITATDMFANPNRKPGDLGFDPLSLGSNPATRSRRVLPRQLQAAPIFAMAPPFPLVFSHWNCSNLVTLLSTSHTIMYTCKK